MTQPALEARLRSALRVGAAAVFVMTPVELVFTEHFDSTLQLIPFVAAGLGLVALAVFRAPGVWARRLSSALLGLVCVLGVLGMWEHFEHNLEFEREIHPNLSAGEAVRGAFFGAGPALAPGILLLGAGLAWASALRSEASVVSHGTATRGP